MAERVGREGEQLGNYRLLSLLGRGGFAEVYLGEHIYLDTLAAIKVLHTRLASEDVEHFKAEARTVARLVHPHIVRVLEFNVEDLVPYLVTDYAPNGTLRQRHTRGVQLTLPTLVSYVMQVASALQYAHEQKVIHRDVKPENMLIGRHNEILLSDFGIALVAQSSRYEGAQGMQELAGTIAYMAPEQIHSQACPNSDQYSLGVVVYEWLSGTRPFQGSFAEIAVKQTLTPPPSLREKVPALPQPVEDVVMKALAKDPDARFPSVQDFAMALEEAAGLEPGSSSFFRRISLPEPQSSSSGPPVLVSNAEVPAEEFATVPELLPPPALTSPAPAMTSLLRETTADKQPMTTARLPQAPRAGVHKVSRRSILVGLAGVAAASAVGGSIAWLAHLHGQQAAPTPSANQGRTLYTFQGHMGWVWSAAWSPVAARVASGSSDNTAQVWDATSGDHLNIYHGHTDTVYVVAWSPDGKRIASGSYDKTVQVWDATFGDHFYTYPGHSSWVWTVAWSPAGDRIASAGGDKTVQVWNAIDGRNPYVYRGHTDTVYALAWSPAGTRIASASVDGMLQVWNAANGNLFYTLPLKDTTIWSLAWSPDGKHIAAAGDNKVVQVLNAADGAHLFTCSGHTGFIYAVAWSRDSKHLASASDDHTVRIWDGVDGHRVFTYTGHTGSVRSVSWSPDNSSLASGSWDETVQVWRGG